MTVYVIEDLDFFLEQARNCRHKLYQINQFATGIEVRLRAGTLGFRKEYKSESDEEFQKIKRIIETEGFIEVIETMSDDQFFI